MGKWGRKKSNNKETLLGYIACLSEEKCGEIYSWLMGKTPDKKLEFDKVKLSQEEYSKLVWMWGEDKTQKCIDILNEWLGKRKKLAPHISYYRNIIGWVERKYYQLYPANDKSIQNYIEIKERWQALKYIRSVPKELRADDCEIQMLIDRFKINPLEDI